MAIVKGPFQIAWGDNVITDVEEVNVEHTIDSEDFVTLQGRTLEIDGNSKVTATITLLASDIDALGALLPQNFIANGETLSTGETVTDADGAIDLTPRACDESAVYNHLIITSCENPGTVFRIVNARTKFEGIEFSEKVQKVMIKFIGEAAADEATAQFFHEDAIPSVS
jgi:hypothetical protein